MADLPLPGAFTRANPLPFPRRVIERRIEALIALLDEHDPDCDLEDGDEDCCAADDDNPHPLALRVDHWPGDPVDAEEDIHFA